MQISDSDKAKIWELVLKGKFEQAKMLARETKKTAQHTAQLLQEKRLQIAAFLTHAPQVAKDFFSTMSPGEQQDAMNTFRYNPTTIDILDKNGDIIETMENEDHTVPDSELKPWMIEKDEVGNTFFSFETIKNDELVPTYLEWENLLRVMPAGDYIKSWNWGRAWKQLFALLWGKLSGLRSSGRARDVEAFGCFWSRSDGYDKDCAFALRSNEDEGGIFGCHYADLRPVRRRARTVG
jgi:hypothetical protein